MLNNSSMQWIENEIDQLAGNLGNAQIPIAELCESLERIRERLRWPGGVELSSSDAAAPIAGRETREDASTIPAPSERATFIRHTVSPEDSEWIEQVRSHTYAAATSDDESFTPEAALESGPFADDDMARRYLVEHLRRCIDAVEAGSIECVQHVGSLAESLKILARELALEPGEFETDFEAFDGWGPDVDLLESLGIRRNEEPDWLSVAETRNAERLAACLESCGRGEIDRPVYHAAYLSPSKTDGAGPA